MRKQAYVVLILLITALNSFAQSDLGVIWQKNDYTTLPSHLNRVIKQSDGTYLANGSIVQNGRHLGYILQIDEAGNKLQEHILTPPNVQEWTDGNGTATSSIAFSYVTSTKDIIAFGLIQNTGANQSIKGNIIGGSYTLATSPYLRNGLWVIKISPQGTVYFNKLDRCNSFFASVLEHKTDQYLVSGYDYSEGNTKQLLLRVYNTDGNWVYDNNSPGGQNYASSGHITTDNVFRLSNGNYLLGAYNEVKEYDYNTFAYVKTYAQSLKQNQGCVSPAGVANSSTHADWSLTSNNGFWASSRMGYGANAEHYGSVFYLKDKNDNLVQCNVIQPATALRNIIYNPPLLLPGSTTEYVGTKKNNGINYMYMCKDNTTGFTLTDGAQYPYNTILSTTSHTDGFFSCGQDNNTGRAAIAKLSTCANFITPDTATIHMAMTPQVTVNKTFRYQGAKGASANDIKYNLDIRVSKGTVNGQPAGSILEKIDTTTVQSYASSGGSASGNAFTLNRTYTVDTDTDAELELIFTLKDSYMTAGVAQQCNQTYIVKVRIMNVSSTLFSDDVWFFGQNTGTPEGSAAIGNAFTSKGIIFYNDNGTVKAKDASGVSAVNSWENSLSVSTPACNGSFIFYTQHDTIYNSNHQPMKNGGFSGHTSCGDGLAAAYLGNNKYILVAMSTAGYGNLNYYMIDMNGENGLGEVFDTGVIDNSNDVAEGIELIPVVNTYNQYWLVYMLGRTRSEIVVKKIDGTNPSAPVITNVGTLTLNIHPNAWRMQADPTYTKIAINTGSSLSGNTDKHHFLDFNPVTGAISYNRSLTTSIYSSYSSYVFYKNYLYIAESQLDIQYKIFQYDINTWTLLDDYTITYTPPSSGTTQRWHGGGMKMGPDGKIYFIRQSSPYTGIIHNPDLLLTAPGNVDENGFLHADEFNNEYNGMGIAMSTGLTPPWIDPPSENTPPTTVVDIAEGYQYAPIVVSPLLNDSDIGGAANLNLTSAELVNPTDAAMGTLTWDAAAKTVTFTPDIYYDLQSETVIHISYIARNSGTPVGLCEEGRIEITLKPAKIASTLFSDDVWFFGQNTGTTEGSTAVGNSQTSKAMVFKNEGGSMVAYDYSVLNGGKSSMVNSWENSLSVSTPACNGSFIFYTQHDKVFNANHEEMKNGSFKGHTSCGDGLAAAYLGDNIYILFSVSNAANGDLYYYLIDMNKENGLGEVLSETIIESDGLTTEAIELIPVPDTYNQYWLIYMKRDTKIVYVRKIDGTNPSSPTIGAAVSAFNFTPYLPAGVTNSDYLFRLKSSDNFSKLAFNFFVWNASNANIQLLNFNPLNGSITYDRQIVLQRPTGQQSGTMYADFVFYDKYLYVANSDAYGGGNSHLYIHKIDLTNNTQKYIDFWTSPGTTWSGGGMKMGPDGKIYLIKQNNKYMAVINNPELDLDAPGNFDANGFELLYGGMGLALSTGLTPPWINPPSSNTAPITVDDYMEGTHFDSIRVYPLINDIDDGGVANLNLTGANFITPTDAALGDIFWSAASKEVIFIPKYDYPIQRDTTIYLSYVARNQGTPVGLCEEGKIEVKINYAAVTSTLFSDDVWFFGQNEGAAVNTDQSGTDKTSKGIIFKEINGEIVATDASRISKVNSWENSLSVSTPACNGNFIFYTQHNRVYNANHEPMKGGQTPLSGDGYFSGHYSTADGLAAAYIGDNKFALFAVSNAGAAGSLYYYIIDMNGDNGLGELSTGTQIGTSVAINESIELIPKVNTYNEYWLIYGEKDVSGYTYIKVRHINGTGGNVIIGNETSIQATGRNDIMYSMNISNDFKKISTTYSSGAFQTYNFNPSSGVLSAANYTIVLANTYGSAFSPDNKILYTVRRIGGTVIVNQHNVSNGLLLTSETIITTAGASGGGIKLGPDGKMYIIREGVDWMAVIEKPNLLFTDIGGGVIHDGFKLSSSGNGLAISTGLTPPWINPPSSNQTPIAVNDTVICTLPQTVTIRPLDNDSDPDNDLLFLTGVDFANPADAVKGSVTWNSTTKEVVFTPNSTYSFTNGETIYLNYILKDNGAPVALCDEGLIVIECYYPIAAANDYAVAFPCATTDINVLQNDLTSAGYSLSVTKQGNHGTAVFAGDVLQYTVSGNDCCDMGGLTDTVIYALCVNNGLYCVQAIAVINILRCTDIVLRHNCSIAPQMVLSHQYAGNYLWEYSDDNITWSPLPAYNDMPLCKELVPGYYRATVSYQGTSYVTPVKQLLQIKKIPVPGGMYWYEMELQ